MKYQMTDFLDFHTHILPGVDHGSESLETSLSQLKLAKSFGITKIFATSHFYPHQHTVTSFIERRDKAYLSIKNSGAAIPEIKLGAEVLLCEGLHKLTGLENLTIFGTKLLLLELPFASLTHGMLHAVKRLVENGYEVVLAHADRYPRPRIEALIEHGAKIQLNVDSVASPFARKPLLDWFKRGIVVGLGSDIHGVDTRIYKKFAKAVSKILPYVDELQQKSEEIWKKALPM